MRIAPLIPALVVASMAIHPVLAAAGAAQVEFVAPEKFTDIGPKHPPSASRDVLARLRDHLVRQASRRLPDGQTLHVWITDVDLAGEFEPTQPYYNEVRIVKDQYPPRIELRFRLAGADGSMMKEGTRTLRDAAFLLHGSLDRQDALRYEKSMIDRWLQAEFGG
jgi:hypothetical protein